MHQVYSILDPKDNEVAKPACGSLGMQATQRNS